jgi:exonuclease I
MNAILGVMLDVMRLHKPLVHVPAIAPRTAGALMEILPIRRKPLSRDAVTFVTMDAVADNSPLLAALPDLRLTPFAEGLATYLAP